MTICEKRLKRIAGGEPFFPGEVVAMALELLANSKETLRPEYPETLPCPNTGKSVTHVLYNR
ncbi:hypothetical protein [Klebsiella pneumoniae]|uniref:hypothetical protein n=1 Tax=Klebsiella pneumoniae TaxID=573 RepID=UPI0015C789B3|nr:hypothetical protein [Klebsiella pneumoniae]